MRFVVLFFSLNSLGTRDAINGNRTTHTKSMSSARCDEWVINAYIYKYMCTLYKPSIPYIAISDTSSGPKVSGITNRKITI